MSIPPDPEASGAGEAPRPEAGRIAGAALAGALFSAAGVAALGLTLGLFERTPGPAREAAAGLREFLNAGGWIRLPLWGGTLGALRALGWVRGPGGRWLALCLAAGLLALSLLLRPAVLQSHSVGMPRTAAAKTAAIRRWSYESPDAVRKILALSHDPDENVRQMAVLALGVNGVISILEPPQTQGLSRLGLARLRDQMRARLEECLRDSSVGMRAEAARALWKAPRTFGVEAQAAETLGAILERAERPDVPRRALWLALDAAAGLHHPTLKRAAAKFAATTTDATLRLAATQAMRSDSARTWLLQDSAFPMKGP